MPDERPLRPLLPGTERSVAPPQPRPRDRVASAIGARRREADLFRSQAIKRRHDVLKTQNELYAELFALIQTRPDDESLEILRRIKMGADVESVLRHVRDGDLLVQLSIEPETRLRYQLPYMDSMPAFLLVPDNQYLTTPLYEATFKRPRSSQDLVTPEQSPPSKCMDPYMKPSHAAEVVEPILDRVYARQWTKVIADDGLFRRLITIYLSHQHATFFLFNKELFLDMASNRTQFCSSLLVHAVLAAACQAYKGIPNLAKFWMPDNLQNRFLLEARRLWELELGISRLTSIHAALTYYYRRAPFIDRPPAFAAPNPDVDPTCTEYYMTLHSLFQGPVTAQRTKPGHSQLFHGQTALRIQNEAYIRFETVMRIRHLRHSFDAYDAWGLLFLIYLGNLAIESLSNEDSIVAKLTTTEVIRSTAMLCINGLVSQSRYVYAGTLLSCSLIEQLSPVDRAHLGRYIYPGIGQVDHLFDSEWPLPNIKVERNEEATMNHILKDVRELLIIQKSPE
ncbi:hypothetical protein E8E12_004503 [Didymella heteroderae]|uniref:Sequence-specific DNA binding RNA polymerase II transcription factor n=1 Tax=Didymella heteroderae TaxID=1769908 RepID=A0A9P4WKJ9_9PLEO|nr:hypothetical protein E8E12_004503 [Didymella heteroderae]